MAKLACFLARFEKTGEEVYGAWLDGLIGVPVIEVTKPKSGCFSRPSPSFPGLTVASPTRSAASTDSLQAFSLSFLICSTSLTLNLSGSISSDSSSDSLTFLATFGVLSSFELPVDSLPLLSPLACPGLPGAGDLDSALLVQIATFQLLCPF